MELCALDPEQRPRSAGDVRARLSAMPGAYAPFPHGQQALAHAVEEALASEDAKHRASHERVTEAAENSALPGEPPSLDSSPKRRRRSSAPRAEGSHVSMMERQTPSPRQEAGPPSSESAQTKAIRVKR
jgi:hypothetical protein